MSPGLASHELVALVSLGLAGLVMAAVLGGYGLVLWLASLWRSPASRASRASLAAQAVRAPGAGPPRVSVLVAVRNGEDLVEAKLDNCRALEHPADALEWIFASDGSSDRTEALLRADSDPRLVLTPSSAHEGKAAALNRAARLASGEILVFTDVDALLEPDALIHALPHFADPGVGGVCGRRVIGERGALDDAQRSYISLDSRIKELESRSGSVTSNDGKLYFVRRELFLPLIEGVTDDLFTSLQIVAQGARFVFEPRARARVRLPSRSSGHELERRRRIVARSLFGLMTMRRLLNPLRYGGFAVGLAINKILRRLLPVCLLVVLIASVVLALEQPWARVLLGLQAAFYLAALTRLSSKAHYFCVGNIGTLLGLLDFLGGRRVTKWQPRKADPA